MPGFDTRSSADHRAAQDPAAQCVSAGGVPLASGFRDDLGYDPELGALLTWGMVQR
jgi:hypothetical protein